MAITAHLRFPAMGFSFHIPAKFINSTPSWDLLFGTIRAHAKEAGAKRQPMPTGCCMLETLSRVAGRYLTPLLEPRLALSLRHRFLRCRHKPGFSRMQEPCRESISLRITSFGA